MNKRLAVTSSNDYILQLIRYTTASNMKKHWDFRIPKCTSDTGNTSCLTINEPGSFLGLSNLLDLVRHEISHEHDKQIHRLTFKSGQTLFIKADARAVTVRGARINFNSDAKFPSTTYLCDPSPQKGSGG
ncbi:hypothetical protein QN382_22010 [Pseudomonas sp. 10B1]|uniref:hypothetical protein n=1 Tax=unclassified Pseudomonas TaxID=196821 RepID=UPI002AB41FA7|nr:MULTISPECIES: hypothetical protein [unclassified Pseudomonas]MDY7562619.1 hypothetical protein [Pseudomonas sp. AB6]MEA9995819.1 hypothetical protein [Pseudomonas sp. AA4]MEB0087427.1 hypothetical protein [Pseudomonas sp. RTI1]MEB0127813.1 hypothetical protein [Pseudomonas sp. CCC1.2]MEB0155228.1 hypothetical protein [Pseudomonas sp. CCC4.3]